MASDNEWRKPSDIMKKFQICKKKKKSLSNKSYQKKACSIIKPEQIVSSKKEEHSLNPFAKKDKPLESFLNITKRKSDASSSSAFGKKQKNSFFNMNGSDSLANDSINLEVEESIYLNEDSIQSVFTDTAPRNEIKESFFDELPKDWTIKRKLRFLSPKTFIWCERHRSVDEAKGLNLLQNNPTKIVETTADNLSHLYKSLVYYQHPNLPWLSLFPRFSEDACLLPKTVDVDTFTTTKSLLDLSYVKSSLFDSWMCSLRSVFYLFLQRSCPYFYICSESYTALFRCSDVGEKVECILNPASTGFRNSLTSEGIQFTTLGKKKKKENVENASLVFSEDTNARGRWDSDASDVDEEEDLETELCWKDLERSLQSSMDTSSCENTHLTVVIRDLNNLQLLYNYLLNCPSSISSSGQQANISPTILSPVPFVNSSLKCLKFRSGLAKTGEREENETFLNLKPNRDKYCLDITGPIMPHHFQSLIKLLDKTQEEYNAACSSYTCTSSFNSSCDFDEDNVLQPHLLRKVFARKQKYTWSS